MNTMEQDMVMTIKHLTQLLEEAREDNRQLREELNTVRGLLWMKNTGKDLPAADWTVHYEDLPQYGKCIVDALNSVSCTSFNVSSLKAEGSL